MIIIAKVMARLKKRLELQRSMTFLNRILSDHIFRSTNVNDTGEDDDSVGYNL